jgi:hypothetical protein
VQSNRCTRAAWLEIALTRVFAIMMWHHLAYMVISVAMLGFGAAGSLLVVLGKRLGGSWPARALAWLAAGYGIAVLAAPRGWRHSSRSTRSASGKTNRTWRGWGRSTRSSSFRSFSVAARSGSRSRGSRRT